MTECEDLKGLSMADEAHQKEWREWFKKTFDEDGNLKSTSELNKSPVKERKVEELKF